MSDKFTSAEIAGMLASDIFHFRRYLIVSNVSWGMLPWEADLLVMTPAGYVSEVEIKISIADLKRDRAKAKWRNWDEYHDRLKARWFAMPESVWQHKDAAACIPEGAGVIVCKKPTAWNFGTTIVREPSPNNRAKALTEAERFQLARLGTMRHWSRLSRVSRKTARENPA